MLKIFTNVKQAVKTTKLIDVLLVILTDPSFSENFMVRSRPQLRHLQSQDHTYLTTNFIYSVWSSIGIYNWKHNLHLRLELKQNITDVIFDMYV